LRQFKTDGNVIQHAEVRENRVTLKHHTTAAVRLGGQHVTVQRDGAPAWGFLPQQQA
jgi:hypothetical protein